MSATGGLAARPRVAANLAGAAVASAAATWVVFHGAGLHAPLGAALCWWAGAAGAFALLSVATEGRRLTRDRLGAVAVWTATAVAVAPLVSILVLVVGKGARVVATDFPHFVTSDLSRAGPLQPYTDAGVAHAVVGTVEQVGLAVAVSAPLAVLTAVALSESRRPLARLLSAAIEAASGIPAILAGLVVYLLWVQPRGTGGYSGAAAAAAVSVVMLPSIERTAEEVLRTVPRSVREAALALGASRWRATLHVVLPTARSGLATATVLGTARGVGETAPVLFTAHGAAALNANPFHGPQADLPVQIYGLILSPSANQVDEAWGAALVLVVLVLVLFAAARVIGGPGMVR